VATLKLSILSPEKRFAENLEVEAVTLNGSEGQIQILPGHAAMVGTLEAGSFQYLPSGSGAVKVSGQIVSGFFEVCDERVSVLAETIEVEEAKTAH
jgi:F-type H+-transporting ATPase subunit epsilon